MASAQISTTTRPAYVWNGTQWVPIGDGGGGGLSLESASLVFLSQSNASVIYANSASVANIVADIENNIDTIYDILFEGGAEYLSASGGQVYGDVIIDGDLTVSGSTTYLNTNQLNIEDNLITLNYGVSGSPTLPAGIEVERGDSPNTAIRWNEELDVWEFTNDGSQYNELGSGAGLVLYQSASPDAVALGLEIGAVWIDSDADLTETLSSSHIHAEYLNASSASVTYATRSLLQSDYLTIVNASSTYATKTELNNINLTSAINTASAAAYNAANAYTDQEIASIDLSPYQTVANASSVYLTQTSASSTYATQAQLGTIDVDNLPDIFLMMGG